MAPTPERRAATPLRAVNVRRYDPRPSGGTGPPGPMHVRAASLMPSPPDSSSSRLMPPREKGPGDRCGTLARTLLLLTVASCVGCSWWQRWVHPEANSARHLLEQSRDAEAAGDPRRARMLLEQAVQHDPKDVEVRRRLARLLADEGDLDAALPHAVAAAEGSSDDPEPWVRLAELQMADEAWADAQASLDRATACDPHHVPALMARARLEEQRGRPDAAVEACHRALNADPASSEGRLLLARLHLEAQRPQQAAPLLRSVVDCPAVSAERRTEALRLLGLAYGAEARWDDAALALDSAARQGPTSADDWYRLAYAQYKAGRTEAAGASLAQLAQLAPRHPGGAALANRLSTGSPIRTVAADPHVPGGASLPGTILPLGRPQVPDDPPVPLGWSP